MPRAAHLPRYLAKSQVYMLQTKHDLHARISHPHSRRGALEQTEQHIRQTLPRFPLGLEEQRAHSGRERRRQRAPLAGARIEGEVDARDGGAVRGDVAQARELFRERQREGKRSARLCNEHLQVRVPFIEAHATGFFRLCWSRHGNGEASAVWLEGGDKGVSDDRVDEIADPVRREADAAEVRKDVHERADVVGHLDLGWWRRRVAAAHCAH